MKSKSIFILLIVIFAIGTLNSAYANGGPVIGENQAKISAQNYLNSNNLSYTAVTPGWDDLQLKAIDIKTGEVKWIPESAIEEDRYDIIDGFPVWIVQVENKNNENVGQIYIDANTGEVLKAIINGKVLKSNINDTLLDNIWAILGIFGIIFLIIGIGIGYLIYNRIQR